MLRAMLVTGDSAVFSSQLSAVELESAVRAAMRDGRLAEGDALLARFDSDCGEDGWLSLLALRPEVVLPSARRLVATHRLRALDAIHLAVAREELVHLGGGTPLVFVTRDRQQATAATDLGFSLA